MTEKPPQPPREATLTEPDEATQREVLRLWQEVVELDRQGRIPAIRAGLRTPPDGRGEGRRR
jgi:hypothetical protein